MLQNQPLLFDAVDSDSYVGRPQLESALLKAASAAGGVLLIGPPGSGRTTSLNWVAARIGDRLVVQVDAALALSGLDLAELLLAGVGDALDRSATSSAATRLADEAATEAIRLQVLVRQLREIPPATLLIDNLAHPEAIRTFFGGLRDLLWATRHTFICSCRPSELPLFLAPPADSFFGRRVAISPLSDRELAGFIDNSELAPDEARARVDQVGRQPRQVIAALQSEAGARELSTSLPAGLNPRAAELWRELVSLGRPVSVDDEELRALAGRSSVTLRRHLNELIAAGLIEKRPNSNGRPGRPTLTYLPREVRT